MSQEISLWQEIDILPDLGVLDDLLKDLLPGRNTDSMDFIEDVLKGNWALDPGLFWRYIREYNPDYPESTVYHYSAGESPAGDNYGKITVVLYKENDWEGDRITGILNYDPDEMAQDPLSAVAEVAHYTFTVEVIANTGKASFHHATVYNQQASYDETAVLFEAEGKKLKWDSVRRRWLESNTGNEVTITGTTTINYEIQPHIDYLTGCKFSKTIQEAGDVTGGEAGNP